MMTVPFPQSPDPEEIARRAQATASDPAVSSWTSASAGTGKTYVLARRVLRLLLNGVLPARILCITFTRAAAAEMTNRIARQLSTWALMDDNALYDNLSEMIGRGPNKDETTRARTLFATCLDAPTGMRIQTIHSFCQALLKRFPIEAGAPPHFQVIEETDQRALLDRVRNKVLADAGPDAGRFTPELGLLAPLGGSDELTNLLGEFLKHRGRLRNLLKDEATVAAAIRRLYREAGFSDGVSEVALVTDACAEGQVDREGLIRAVEALENGSKTDINRAVQIAAWLATGEAARPAGLDAYARVFLTGQHQPLARLATRKVVEAMPDILDILTCEADRLADLYNCRKRLRIVERSAALARLGAAVHQQYEAEKNRRAVLDFDDLILKAETLLTHEVENEWVLYKLDGGIDHILVDEAQDTSPQQWRLVEAIAREFFAGAGVQRVQAEDNLSSRTVFAVGDAKQSIFSFQGADPVAFDRVRQQFGEQVTTAGENWSPVDLGVSFRSVQHMLDAVDNTFAKGSVADDIIEDGAVLTHTAQRQGQTGMVELWPVIAPAPSEPPAPWTIPEVALDTTSPTEQLARWLARQVRDWLDGPAGLVWDRTVDPPVRRTARAGDIMILVRRRNELVDALIRALKEEAIEVSGADRMTLIEQLAVMDMLAIADFLLLPEDDLTLATVLKGPLFGFNDDQLFDLAYERGKVSLWSRLQAAHDPESKAAAKALSRLLAMVDYTAPYELLKAILTGDGAPTGRERFWARLGPDAIEPLEELLNLALSYQQDHPPSLQEFLDWLRRSDMVIKRDMESVTDAVRIMTVHGAKGLQAPIVILPDTTRIPKKADKFLWPSLSGNEESDILPLITPSNEDVDTWTADLKAAALKAQRQEYNRLLYVAMTRAEDALIVCGSRGGRGIDGDCWHTLVEQGLRRLNATEIPDEDFDAPILRYGNIVMLEDRSGEPPGTSISDLTVDPALLAPPAPEARRSRSLAPSRPAEDDPAMFIPFHDDAERFRRGQIIHRLLQYLPGAPTGQRDRMAIQFLTRSDDSLTEVEKRRIVAETCAVLDLPEARFLFGPESIAEAPITGVVGETVISGQIDRLAIGERTVSIVDYKTNQSPPEEAAVTPPAYLRQMAAYRILIRRLYPGCSVECFLLWTVVPWLMRIEDSLLDLYEPAGV